MLKLGGAHGATAGELQPFYLQCARSSGDDQPRAGLDHRSGRSTDRSRDRHGLSHAQLLPRPRRFCHGARIEGPHLPVERRGVACPVD